MMRSLLLRSLILGLVSATPLVAFSPSSGASRSALFTSPSKLNVASTTPNNIDNNEATQVNGDTSSSLKNIRPLQNNWWPVSITASLQSDRPNAIELLGQKLVLYRDDGGTSDDGEWKCLADQCSHRFAPLSEGRVVPQSFADDKSSDNEEKRGCASCTLQCAYHGWEFTGDGKCTRVPQSAKPHSVDERRAASVPAYPVREDSGMIWVWSNPDTSTWSLAESIQLPISSLVRNSYDKFGANACFMRDLPYGMELLGENLLDLAHLPFSHHSVGGLDREMGVDLPLRIMSEQERTEYAQWEKDLFGRDDYTVPFAQVEVLNASQTDPIFLSIANRFPTENATATIAFFDACHVRYRRERIPGTFGHVELFMSPTSAGKSRVFLWNTIYTPPPSASQESKPSLKARLAKLSPLAAMKKILLAKLMNPATTRAHSISHAIFDGDGIFLHKQGNRMSRRSLSYRDYSTPSTADLLLNSYRRYLDAAARLSLKEDGSDSTPTNIGEAAARAVSFEGMDNAYTDNIPRKELLDRYNSHTKHCSICLEQLERCEKKRAICENAKTALIGAGGASTVALLSALIPGAAVPASIGRLAGISVATSIVGSVGLRKKKQKLEKQINSYYFEDYVHAEKN